MAARPSSETKAYKVISAPLNTINRRKRKTAKRATQNHHNATFSNRQLKQNAHFAHKPATASHIVHAATAQYAQNYPIKGKLTTSALGAPSQDHTFTDDSVFDHVYLHVILSDFLLPKELNALNSCHPSFHHFYHMLHHINLNVVYKLFQYDPTYASQESIPTERRIQFLFLAIIHRLHVPSIIRSLPGNYTASYRDPDKILTACEAALTPDLLSQLKRVLCHHNPSKLRGHVTAQQRQEARKYGNHASVSKHLKKVEITLNKEERNKYVTVFPCWLERFFPNLFLTPQGLICKPGKKDRLVFDGSFTQSPTSTCLNHFTHTSDEIDLHYGSALNRHLVQIYNLRISYPQTDILLFDDDAAGAFRHVKLHPDVAAAHAYSVGQTLYVPTGSVFGSNVSPHNWEVLAQSRCMLAEHLQSTTDLDLLTQKHKALLDLVRIPKDLDKCPQLLVPATRDNLNPGVFLNGTRGPTKNAMFVDDNLLADIWSHLRPALATSAEALFTLLGEPDTSRRISPLSMTKYKDSDCSYVRRQLGILINTRKLTIGISDDKRITLERLLRFTWHNKCKSFTLREITSLLSLVSNLALTTL